MRVEAAVKGRDGAAGAGCRPVGPAWGVTEQRLREVTKCELNASLILGRVKERPLWYSGNNLLFRLRDVLINRSFTTNRLDHSNNIK